MTVVRRVWVTHRFEGFHRWDDAPPHRAYLASVHRHVFHVTLAVDVQHNDREIEFHDLRDKLIMDCGQLPEELGSCEMIADALSGRMVERYPDRRVAVSVSEDGENGAVIFVLP